MSCKTLVLILGAPPNLSKKLKSNDRSLKNGRREILFFDLSEYEIYTPEYLENAYVELSNRVQKLRENRSGRMLLPERFEGVLIYYFNKGKSSLVEQKFFPEIISREIDFNLEAVRQRIPKNRLSQITNLLTDTLLANIRKDEKILSTLKQELASNANTTPMLLPVKNYPSDGLNNIFDELKGLNGGENLNAQIRAIVKKFRKLFPIVRFENKNVFISKKKILFNSPGIDRHGYLDHNVLTHEAYCWLKGNLRFGALFDSRFHYDCTRKDISENYFLICCEKQNFRLLKTKRHVNVYVNDYLR